MYVPYHFLMSHHTLQAAWSSLLFYIDRAKRPLFVPFSFPFKPTFLSNLLSEVCAISPWLYNNVYGDIKDISNWECECCITG